MDDDFKQKYNNTDDKQNEEGVEQKNNSSLYKYTLSSSTGTILTGLSPLFKYSATHRGSALPAFICLLLVTCVNYMLSPMRDAAALAVGVSHIPALTLASTWLALISSVTIGWLFEAPDPNRSAFWGRWGFSRGDTQGTSLALFYRFFEVFLLLVAGAFKLSELPVSSIRKFFQFSSTPLIGETLIQYMAVKVGKIGYVIFYLFINLMKLHATSLLWGVTSEAMEYEEHAELREGKTPQTENKTEGFHEKKKGGRSRIRLKRLAFVGLGGTIGGIIGSIITSLTAHSLRLSGLLLICVVLLEMSANLSIELGRIMQRHWEEEQQEFLNYLNCPNHVSNMHRGNDQSTNIPQQLSFHNLEKIGIDSSMKKSPSFGSMKRAASGSSLNNLRRVQSLTVLKKNTGQNSSKSLQKSYSIDSIKIAERSKHKEDIPDVITMSSTGTDSTESSSSINVGCSPNPTENNSFRQRLARGIKTILRSKLLLAIFTYNALYASTSVLLSFQRAELVANRTEEGGTVPSQTSAESDTAFIAKINIVSNIAVFLLQASGFGAFVAHSCGQRGTLALMPAVRLFGVFLLLYWHTVDKGKPPNLMMFLVLDEFTKVINFAIAKPVRENLWRGLSNEARYEAKPIVDTLANRWGGGSIAFVVGCIDRFLDFLNFSDEGRGDRSVFGFPPALLLLLLISVWWMGVSAHLGCVRSRIDIELKKHQ